MMKRFYSRILAVSPTTNFEYPNPVIILSNSIATSLQSKLSNKGYLSIGVQPQSDTQQSVIKEIREITRSLYSPVFIGYGIHCLTLQKYLESFGSAGSVFVDPITNPNSKEETLWMSLNQDKVKLESCQDTYLSMVVFAREKHEMVDRLGTEFILKGANYEDDIIHWIDSL